jgi:hypothetical protein
MAEAVAITPQALDEARSRHAVAAMSEEPA